MSVVKHCMFKGINRLTGERGGGAATAGGGWEGGVDNSHPEGGGQRGVHAGRAAHVRVRVRETAHEGQRGRAARHRQKAISRHRHEQQLQDGAAAEAPLAVQYQKRVNRDVIPLSRSSYSQPLPPLPARPPRLPSPPTTLTCRSATR